jgi:dihydroneopterin aldolase/2-amino-4-hydroxy-6-hydroxymethyldihydropteridine diphosphokinase
MDKIIIDSLEIFATHGVLDAEKTLGQKFIVSEELFLSLREAGNSDNLNKTVNYARVCENITKIMQRDTYDLIETCAEKIASYILHKYASVSAITVTVEKPHEPDSQSVRNLAVQITRGWNKVYLGLGANIGDAKLTLDSAIEKIDENNDMRIIRKSSYYKTRHISDIPQEDYLNAVVEIETIFTPHELIRCLMQIESELGRERSVRFAPRTIDIDVLTYNSLITDDTEIILPHPRMHERLFVLVPFCELNPYYVHPLLNQRMIDLKLNLEKTQTL